MKTLRTTLWLSTGLLGLCALVAMPASADQVILDDLIVDGSICAGQDCVNGESFGFDTLRLKENNLRIKAQDTSTSASFPTNDWQITFNESANGGLNKFSIDDIDGGRIPFTIEAGARNNALYVESSGDIGIGTANPVADVHIVTGNTPTLRLEQDGSSGFTAQTWDVAGNEANFFIRDATNGSTLPFRIFPGAPNNAFNILASGDIGVGTTSPEDELHIIRSATTDVIALLESTAGTTQNVGFSFENPLRTWTIFNNVNGNFRLNVSGGLAAVLQIDGATGDLTTNYNTNLGNDGADITTVTGTFINASSRTFKTDFEPVDRQELLSRLAELPLNEWSLKDDASGARHIGPFSEDFEAVFGLGTRGKYIVPLDVQGVTIAAVQGLHETVESLQEENARLRERLEALEAALAQR